MVGYKKIIENMVDSSVHDYVEKRINDYVGYPEFLPHHPPGIYQHQSRLNQTFQRSNMNVFSSSP